MKPSITLEGIKHGNVWHLVNRARRALTAAGLPGGSDIKDRCLNENAKLSFNEAILVVLEYVEVEPCKQQ